MTKLFNVSSTRLTYRLMGEADGDLLFELDQDPLVMKYINGGLPNSRQTIDKVMIPRMLSYRNPLKGWGLWQVNLSKSEEYIGWVLVRPMHFFTDTPEWSNLELGWRFKNSSWGQGYATEAALCIVNTVAAMGDVKLFSAIALPENNGSIAVMKKLGMKYIKTYLHTDPLGNHEVVYYQRPF